MYSWSIEDLQWLRRHKNGKEQRRLAMRHRKKEGKNSEQAFQGRNIQEE